MKRERVGKHCALELEGYESGTPQMGTRLWRSEHELTKARAERDRYREALEELVEIMRVDSSALALTVYRVCCKALEG
jgi:hypothetical protein